MRKLSVLIIILALGLIVSGCKTEVVKYCRIIYDGNGGTSENRPVDTTNYTIGQKAVVLSNTYDKTGFAFKHWNTHWLDSGTSYSPGEKIEIPDAYFIHLYAIWE